VAVGDAGLLAAVEGPAEARALAAAVSGARWPGVLDVVGGLRTVLVTVTPGRADLDDLCARVAWLGPATLAAARPRAHRLAVVLDGPDLDEVCGLAKVAPDELADLLAGAVLEVAVVGFSPGFAYLSGLPPPLAAVGRRSAPRPSVAAGSLALAGGFAAVYPQATPGGWQLVGRTPARLFDPRTPPYAVLAPGDTVRLDPVAGDAGAAPPPPARRAMRVAEGARPAFVVVDPGVLSMVEDAGRRGMAHLGVPGAGPADPLTHALANRLVGNPVTAAALEVTARGPVLVATDHLHVAVVGHAPVTVDGREVGAGHVVPVAPAQRLAVGPVEAGLRCYLAVAGGLAAPEVMGSCSTDVLARIGPGPLVAGDELGRAGPAGPMADRLAPGAPGLPEGAGRRRVLRVLPGPHAGWFPDGALDRLAGAVWVVGGASDRVGLRLSPASGPGVERRHGELASEGMVTGAVQVPPDGSPVVLGPDHATLGGYPVVAVVAACDRWLIGQCRPGDEVELAPVTPAEAAAALGDLVARASAGVVGRYPVVPG
jgi:KipI family sensor histidine kinase inhibitor